MKKEYAICRTEKIKAWSTLSKSVGHNLRTSNDTRSHLAKNHPEPIRVLTGNPEWISDWKNDVKGMWLPKLKQGDSHTLAREFFLGASPEFWEGKSKAEIASWAEDNITWLRDRFGADRVKLAVLHLDEQSPHIAAYVVPLKADTNRKGVVNTTRGNGWTLSDNGALGLGGSSNDLVKLQDEYAIAMVNFGLHRGERHSKAKHQTIRQWQTQMAAATAEGVAVPKPIPATIKDRLDIEDYGKRVAKQAGLEVYKAMKPAMLQAKRVKKLEGQIKQQAGMIEHLKAAMEVFKRALERLLGSEVTLDGLAGLQALQRALIPSEPLPEALPPVRKVSRAARPDAVERHRVRHGLP